MRHFVATLAVSGGLALSGWLAATPTLAADKAERARAASQMVRQALEQEVYGSNADRRRLLDSALDLVPSLTEAFWHAGFVWAYDQWLTADELSDFAAKDRRLAEYRKLRGEYAQTVEGQLALADWCAKRKLIDQHRAHLIKVLELDPDHQQARGQLGFRRVDGVWLSREEIQQAGARVRRVTAGLRQWVPKLTRIRRELSGRGLRQREAAEKRLQQIDDPAAIPAIEVVFCGQDEQSALLGVETLDQITAADGSAALARQAVFSPWENVRQAAAKKLKKRDKAGYVPQLLAAMQTPVQSRAQLYQAPTGRLTYRHTLYREGREEAALAVFDTNYYRSFYRTGPPIVSGVGRTLSRVTLRVPSPQEQFMMVREDAAIKAGAIQEAVDRQNTLIVQFNRRVCGVLSTATGVVRPPDPQSWWKWWNEHNEVFVSGSKPLETTYRRDTRDVHLPSRLVLSYLSCLQAGTKVWTELGPKPIEQIQVGDLVVSQDIETGQLALKPVLRTTVRPPDC